MRLFLLAILALPIVAQVTPKTQVCNSTGSVCGPVTSNGQTVQGAGAAGSAAGGVMTVQGSASGTPVPISGTVTITPSGTQAVSCTAANCAVNEAQVSGTAVSVNNGTADAGTQRVTLASDGTGKVGLNAGVAIIGKVGIDQTTPGTTNGVQVNAALPAGANVIGHVIADTGSTTAATQATAANLNATVVGTGTFGVQVTSLVAGDPCTGTAKTFFSISQTTNTQIITGTSAKKIYFCAFDVVGADAENISVVEGTGTVCATNTIAVPGFPAATAAAGWNFAANGGIAKGGGIGSIAGTSVNADNVCLFQSGSGRVAGGGSIVVQ